MQCFHWRRLHLFIYRATLNPSFPPPLPSRSLMLALKSFTNNSRSQTLNDLHPLHEIKRFYVDQYYFLPLNSPFSFPFPFLYYQSTARYIRRIF